MSSHPSPLLEDIILLCLEALEESAPLLAEAKEHLRSLVCKDGRISATLLEEHQYIAHGLSWFSTYYAGMDQLVNWCQSLVLNRKSTKIDLLILQIGFAEYLSQFYTGISMSQGEIIRLSAFEINPEAPGKATALLLACGNSDIARKALGEALARDSGSLTFGADGLDEEYTMIREQFRKFTEKRVSPFAHEWHLKDELIPTEIITEMGEMGVFGLTIPEAYGGFGMSKTAMCVVTEELARGYIGVGSLGTRSEIAAELILGGGTEAQKEKWLPRIADASLLPTAVFTEPNTGSDLGSLRTRAKRNGDTYTITGNKTWITHAARADIMTMLVRTGEGSDYTGLSMILGEKPRGTAEDDFPAKGMSGSEIGVLGYRGMKEYELGFDSFEVPAENLLGEVEGQGFKQLMKTFEAARIQTAARAVGVAQNALEVSLKYAQDRVQFGKPLLAFPRVYGKLAMMAVEIAIARQLTYFAAKEKDEGRRCDLEAGMAKLLAARVAWAAADNGVQIHGGNGFAMEYPISRILCDARILSIFEGAAEIQANVIVRRLLG
ncbi:MAG: acyl-CoA dehydrogenase family protein [Rhodobacteraceae bacterium]|nr:acyl-CoA dehydrogenase family protein [Paracoccaceae bacterium]